MAYYFTEPSHTFGEYLLVPGYSSEQCVPANVSLQTPLVKFRREEEPKIKMNIPMTSAIMQAVSNDTMAIALAREGGVSFIYGSQTPEQEAAMISRVKNYKSGFVSSDSNIKPTTTLGEVLALKDATGHSTMAVTEDGTPNGKLVGIVTSRDYRVTRMSFDTPVKDFMTPFERLIYADANLTLPQANDLIWEHKLNMLPLIDENQRLRYMVFRKDYTDNKENELELIDERKRYIVGAGINTRDYTERVPALLEAGADVLCIDSSEGYSEWQKKTLEYIHKEFGEDVKVGAGNVVDGEGFRFLADAGADFVKVGIGGGIVHDYHMTLALAMGADFMMLGRYFSRFDESPTDKVKVNGTYYKEYWGEGSNRARNWQRYDLGGDRKLSFEEGVDSYVPYAGSLRDNIHISLSKIRSTMCNCGALNLSELRDKAKITLVSSTSIVEGGSHDVILKDKFGRD